ncbi:unnamed protein product [Heterobilharzia americana]|nr:unnamed protein product [Heterobilharzia americana]
MRFASSINIHIFFYANTTAMLATAQNGGPATFVAINNMFSASPSSLPSTPGAMLSMPSNMMSSNIGTTQGMNTTQFILPPNNFTPNPTNLTCTVPLSSPPQLQGPILPFFAPGSGGLLSSNPVSLSVPSPFGTHMHHFVQPGQSNSLSSFSSTVSSSGNVSTVPVSLFPSNNHISLTSVSSNILSSQPMVLPTFPVSFNNQAQTNSVGILPIPLGMNQPLSSNPMTETTNSFLMSSPNYTTPIYTATLYPLSTPAILPATTIASLPSHLSTTSYSSSASSSTVSMDYTLAPSSVKSEKPLLTLPPKVTGIKNIEALEAVDFHRDAILDAIDKLRERKARPDFERISCLLKRHQNINYEQTQLCLQRLADAGAVVCVDYKGNLSYRNPSKWRKTAATSGAVDAIRRLMDNNPYNQSTKTCTNLIPFSQPGPNGGYSVLQIERALQFLIGGDEIDATNPMPQLTGATLRVCLDREATHGKLAKTIDGRYVLDETGERKKAYQTTNIVHTPQMANKKLLPPNTLSNAYLTSNGSCSKSINKLGSSFDRNNTLTRLHPLAAKQTSSTTNGKPMTLPITPNFSMPPLTSGRRGRPPGSKAKKTSNEINSCEKKIRVENSSSTYGNASIIGGSGGRLDSNACSALTTTSSIFVPDSTNTSNLIPTSCFTSNIINDLPFSSSLPVLPSSSFITVIASSSNNCPNMLPGTILPGHFSAASSIPIDSSLMTTISSPFLSFPLSQGLPLPSLFPSTSNVLTNTSQLTIPMKHNGLSTPDSFISDIDSCGTDKQMGKKVLFVVVVEVCQHVKKLFLSARTVAFMHSIVSIIFVSSESMKGDKSNRDSNPSIVYSLARSDQPMNFSHDRHNDDDNNIQARGCYTTLFTSTSLENKSLGYLKYFLPQFTNCSLITHSFGDVRHEINEENKSQLINEKSLTPSLNFSHKLEYMHTYNVRNQIPEITFNSLKRPCLISMDETSQFPLKQYPLESVFNSSIRTCQSLSNIFVNDLKNSSSIPERLSYPLEYIHRNNTSNISVILTKTSEATEIISSSIHSKIVDTNIPKFKKTFQSAEYCNNLESLTTTTTTTTSHVEITKKSEKSKLPSIHLSSNNSTEDFKDVDHVPEKISTTTTTTTNDNDNNNSSKVTGFKHEPRKRKAQSNCYTVTIANPVTISKCDIHSNLKMGSLSQSVHTYSTSIPSKSSINSSVSIINNICEQMSYPTDHHSINHTTVSFLNRSKPINHTSFPLKPINVSNRPILPNPLRKYPNTLLVNTRLGFKSIRNTPVIQSIHHKKLGSKSLINMNKSVTQYQQQSIIVPSTTSNVSKSLNRDKNTQLTRDNQLLTLQSSIIASKTISNNDVTVGTVSNSNNQSTGMISPAVLQILPNNHIIFYIPTNPKLLNTRFYSSPEEDLLWRTNFFGKQNPQQLVYTLIYLFAKLLHLRTSHQLYQLRYGLNSQLKLILYNTDNNDKKGNNETDDSQLISRKIMKNLSISDRNWCSGLVYRPDLSCTSLIKSSVSSLHSSSSSSSSAAATLSPAMTTTTTSTGIDQKLYSYFDYLDENSPQDYTMGQDIKLYTVINYFNNISSSLGPSHNKQSMPMDSINDYILEHNSVNNHERCIVCYHEFYMSRRSNSTFETRGDNYFLAWQTNSIQENIWFNYRPIGPTHLSTILRKIESTLAYAAVHQRQRRRRQQQQQQINSSLRRLSTYNHTLIKSSRLSPIQSNYELQLNNSHNSPVDLVIRKRHQNDKQICNQITNTTAAATTTTTSTITTTNSDDNTNELSLKYNNKHQRSVQQSNCQISINAHPTCLDYWPELTERARQSPWQCSDCKTCTVCNNREYKSDLIICDALEPIDRSLPWVCTTCQNEGYRVAIGTLPTGMNSQNSLSFEKINNSNNYTNSPLKEINSSHDSIRIETKIDLNKSVIEESLDKSIESSSNSSIDDMNSPTKITPTTTTASNIISNENILVNSINPTNHSVILSPTRSYSITSTSSVDNNISEEVNMNTTISNQMDSGSLQKDESSTSSTPQESTENANRISPSTQTSTSDLHLHQSNIGNNKDGDIGLKNGTEAKKDIDIMDNDDDDGVNDDNHESISTRPNDVSVWSVDHVQQWLLEEGFPREAEAFYQQEIDGTCLLLMKRMDVLTELGIKLGPAVKIYERIKRFQSQCGSPS